MIATGVTRDLQGIFSIGIELKRLRSDQKHVIKNGRMETDETENGNGKAEIWKWSSEIQ